MTRIKIISSIVLATIFLASQVIAVGAAPATQDTTPITVTVESITLETDAATGATTAVIVTLIEGTAPPQTVRLSPVDATTLELLNDDGTINSDALDTSIEIDPALLIPDAPEEEAQHPVGSALSDFFSELLGVDYATIMDYHDDGVGFGVIAQALWMTNALVSDEEDTELSPEELFAAILEAKQNHDYSGITLPDGSTPENWGQFRKAVMHDREKSKENLGAIMSGHATDDSQGDDTQAEPQSNGNGNSSGNGNNGNNGNGNNGNGNNGNGNSNGNNGNGNDKDKDKDKEKGNNH